MELKYSILKSGSSGNCIIIENYIAIDMGVSYRQIKPYLKDLKVICLTHLWLHSDHFNKSCIRQIFFDYPNIKFICREWLVEELIKLKVNKKNIFVLENLKKYDLGKFIIKPIDTYHDVSNTSYLIDLKPIKIYYATDTYKLDYLDCLRGLDYYFVEKNYNEEEIKKRIEEKELNGEYVYEKRVLNSHMSEEEINKFLLEMMNDNSQYVYCHQHIEREEKTNW